MWGVGGGGGGGGVEEKSWVKRMKRAKGERRVK